MNAYSLGVGLKVVLLGLVFAVMAVNAPALNVGYTDITVWDHMGYPAGDGYANENDENEPGASYSQRYDLEAMIIDSTDANATFLYLIGGYDFAGRPRERFRPGHLFIDVNDDAFYGNENTWDSGNPYAEHSAFGYDMAIMPVVDSYGDLHCENDDDYTGWQVVGLGPNSSTYGVLYDELDGSNPWRVRAGYTPLQSANVTMGCLDTDIFGLGLTMDSWNRHYFMRVELNGVLADVDSMLFHYTMHCGNDNLIGKYECVPDGGMTLLLLGLSLCALGMGHRARADQGS